MAGTGMRAPGADIFEMSVSEVVEAVTDTAQVKPRTDVLNTQRLPTKVPTYVLTTCRHVALVEQLRP